MKNGRRTAVYHGVPSKNPATKRNVDELKQKAIDGKKAQLHKIVGEGLAFAGFLDVKQIELMFLPSIIEETRKKLADLKVQEDKLRTEIAELQKQCIQTTANPDLPRNTLEVKAAFQLVIKFLEDNKNATHEEIKNYCEQQIAACDSGWW